MCILQFFRAGFDMRLGPWAHVLGSLGILSLTSLGEKKIVFWRILDKL